MTAEHDSPKWEHAQIPNTTTFSCLVETESGHQLHGIVEICHGHPQLIVPLFGEFYPTEEGKNRSKLDLVAESLADIDYPEIYRTIGLTYGETDNARLMGLNASAPFTGALFSAELHVTTNVSSESTPALQASVFTNKLVTEVPSLTITPQSPQSSPVSL